MNIKDKFVLQNIGHAIELQKKYGIHPIISLSQSAKETGWGQSFLATNHNNYFGMMATGSKNEHWTGEIYQKDSKSRKWRKYNNPLQSFLDYGRLLNTSISYVDLKQHFDDPGKFAKGIASSNYITDSDNRQKYYSDLISIQNSIVIVIKTQQLNVKHNIVLPLAVVITVAVLLTKLF